MHHILSTISKHLVFEAASDIREQFGLEYPLSKNDIFSIIREYGGTIEKTTLLEDSFAIRRLGRHRFSIAVPAHLGRKDTPYFYAVALGYLFVVMGYDTDVEEWSSSTVLYEDEEYSLEHFLLAQYFALVLLMPADVFVAVVKSATYKGKCFVGEVADWFGLPAPVVMERGRMLNLL